MFALVRFVEDDKDKRYVISVADIENFEPKNELDFDNTKTYDAYWQDEDEDNSGIYVVQILKLAATKEEMEREMKVKRVHVPPIRMSEVDNVTECGVPAAARKKSLKQQEKAKQQNQITSKKQQYEDVLKRHVSHSLQKNAAIPGHSSIGRKASKKRKPQILDDSTESEDESVVSSRELKNAVKEAKYWKQRYRLEQEHTASLKRELDFLKRKVELQLSSFQQTLDEVAKRQQDALPVVAPSILPNGAVEASRRDPTAARGAATEQAAAAEKDVGGTASVVPTPAGPSEEAPASSCFTADAPRSAELEASVLDDAQDFTLTSGGLFHLTQGVYIKPDQAEKLFKNKKPSIVVRDSAQLLWGIETLSKRSVSGRLAPTKSGSCEVPAEQLTPAKLEVVYGCLRHWGKVHGVDTSVAECSVPRILSEKIQDVKRRLRLLPKDNV
ncbi:BEN domain-containing protein 5-like isoform X2 [Amblyomma americanum]